MWSDWAHKTKALSHFSIFTSIHTCEQWMYFPYPLYHFRPSWMDSTFQRELRDGAVSVCMTSVLPP